MLHPIKTALTLLVGLTFIGSALAGEDGRISDGTPSRKNRSAGPAGAWYRSNRARNEVIVKNNTSDYMTFFVYSGHQRGTVDVRQMIRIGAPVYTVIVAPHQQSYLDQRDRYYWVYAKPGHCGIDLQRNRISGS